MAFNLTQLVDFILTRYEAYVEKRLIDFCNGRYSKCLLKNMLPVSDRPVSSSDIQTTSEYGVFCVCSQNSKTPNVVYTVDITRGVCSCFVGNSGKLCKHASVVLLQLDKEHATSFNLVSLLNKTIFFEVATGVSPPSGWLLPLKTNPNEVQSRIIESVSGESLNNPSTSAVFLSQADETQSTDLPITLNPDQEEQLNSYFDRIKTGIRCNPEIFVPAVSKMLTNIKDYASTETGFVTMLCTMGKYNGIELANRRNTSHLKWHGIKIGVQPTAVGRRKLCLSGKRKLSAGRPRLDAKIVRHKDLSVHDYTTLGSVPARKRKATQNLQDCVFRNSGLGGKKQAKC